MTTAKKLLTAADLLALPDDGKRYELIRGELIAMPPASHEHGRVAERFGRRIGNFAEEHDLGHGIAAETGVHIERNPDTMRAPRLRIHLLRANGGTASAARLCRSRSRFSAGSSFTRRPTA